MCTEPGSEKTVTQVENLIVVEHIAEHDGQGTERQKQPDGMGTAVLPRITGENHTLYLLAWILPVELFLMCVFSFVCNRCEIRSGYFCKLSCSEFRGRGYISVFYQGLFEGRFVVSENSLLNRVFQYKLNAMEN